MSAGRCMVADDCGTRALRHEKGSEVTPGHRSQYTIRGQKLFALPEDTWLDGEHHSLRTEPANLDTISKQVFIFTGNTLYT